MNQRLALLQPYPFERLRRLLADVGSPSGLHHIPLSIGEPQHTPPAFIRNALIDALDTLGRYPQTIGLPLLRSTIAGWLASRFRLPGGSIDPETMVLPVNGTREALFAFVQTIVDDTQSSAGRPAVLMPNPFYQIYEGAALLAGAEPVFLDCNAANGFIPDLDAVEVALWKRCRILFLCNPGNPTGTVLSIDYLQHALRLAERYGFIVVADECYSEIYRDERDPPPGLLQAAMAMGNERFEHCAVFHSLSKRSSVPGLRSGFVAGEARAMAAFLLYRTYHGSAMPMHTQLASIAAWQDEDHVRANRLLYREKFDKVAPILREVMTIEIPDGGFYLWPHVSDGETFTRRLFAEQHVTVLPGAYLARASARGINPGRDRVRISLVASVEDCVAAAERIRRLLLTQTL